MTASMELETYWDMAADSRHGSMSTSVTVE